MTSAHDDSEGVWQTYNHLLGAQATQPLSSSGAFIIFINSGLAGVLGALAAVAFGASIAVVAVVAGLSALAFIGVSVALGIRQYRRILKRRETLYPHT